MPAINPEIVVWARETAGLSLEEAARKLAFQDSKNSTAVEKLVAYESELKEPSRALLVRMAKVYRRPLLMFYLPGKPRIGDRGQDFRTLPDGEGAEDNPLVDALIREIRARQSVIREVLIEEEEAHKLGFVGSGDMAEGAARMTERVTQALSLDFAVFRNQSSHGDAFKVIRKAVEDAGVFVILQGNLGSYHSNISLLAYRGFALADDVAPFIVINDTDAKSAWSFTLIHEFVHLLLGQTGISGLIAEKQVEKFCNDVASEFLLPEKEFAQFKPGDGGFEELCEAVSGYAFAHKVSSSHIAYKLFKRGHVSKTTYDRLSAFYREKWRTQQEKARAQNRAKDGGPSAITMRRYKLGALVALVQRFTQSGALSTTSAGMLLGTRPLKVHNFWWKP
jgi:Zn-dependent peptidase ImmA (M78 family)/transcriptional regulator with XRE-family HTH domain